MQFASKTKLFLLRARCFNLSAVQGCARFRNTFCYCSMRGAVTFQLCASQGCVKKILRFFVKFMKKQQARFFCFSLQLSMKIKTKLPTKKHEFSCQEYYCANGVFFDFLLILLQQTNKKTMTIQNNFYPFLSSCRHKTLNLIDSL